MWYWIGMLVGWTACVGIALADFRFREIHLFWLVVFGLAGGMARFQIWGPLFWTNWLTNILLTFFLLGVVLLFFRLRDGGKVMDVKLGWGDIVMLLALASWLHPLHFVLFYTCTVSLLCLGFLLLWQAGKIKRDYPIPLAGFLALAFLGFSVFQLW
jgi:hypothetical protein